MMFGLALAPLMVGQVMLTLVSTLLKLKRIIILNNSYENSNARTYGMVL
jgi:hypothetical protein